MKTRLFYSSLLIIALIVSLASCQEEELSTTDQNTDTQPAQEAHEIALALIELGDAPATDEGAKAYQEGFENLTFEELNAFYKVLYERSLADASAENDLSQQATIERWYAQRLEENRLAMSLFDLPANRLNEKQLYRLHEGQKENIANGKMAFDDPDTCPFADFDENAPSSSRSGTDFFRATNTMFVRNNTDTEDQDCDCQVAFPTTDGRFRFAFGTTNQMRNLINRGFPRGFGGAVSRRVVRSGPSAGTYLLFGSGRAGNVIAGNYPSCAVLSRDVVLSRFQR